MYDHCELCRHCPGYRPPPFKGAEGNYTRKGVDLAGCGICDSACDDRSIDVYDRGEGFKDSHIDAMEYANVVS